MADSPSKLQSLIQETRNLRRRLEAIVEKFPEADLEVGQSVLGRLFSLHWRNEVGRAYGPYPEKEGRVSAWLKDYFTYLTELDGFFVESLQPQLFATLPCRAAPSDVSGAECVVLLKRQEAVLMAHLEKQTGRGQLADSVSLDRLRTDLRLAIKRDGVKAIQKRTNLSPDTITDVAHGRTKRPQAETLRALKNCLYNLQPNNAATSGR